jgi:ATP-dependent helicase IRC3
MATGTGKTVVAAKLIPEMASRLPNRQTFMLSHTDELVRQNAAKLQAVNSNLKVGIEMAGQNADANSDVISGSVATLGRAGSKRLDKFNRGMVGTIVVDEAHHSITDAYQRVLNWSGLLSPTTSGLLVGITATPARADGVTLEGTYEKISYVYGIRQAISDGWLCRIRGFRVTTDTTIDVSKSAGDFVKSELALAVNTDERNKRVVDGWIKLGGQRKTIAFTVDIEHAVKLAEEFKSRGISAEAVWGDDPERAAKLERHRNGDIAVLCNCSVLTEGYDDPSIACVLLARPTASPVLFAQMVGRGTRLYEGKVDLLVIDVVDATVSHSVVTLPTLMGLANVLDLNGGDLLEAVEALEAAQADNPTVDFSKLESLAGLKQLIEQVNMLEVRFPPEVEAASDLTWFRAVDGGYKMLVPAEGEGQGFVRVFENTLGQWELAGKINGEEFHGKRTTMEDAFKTCDEQVRKRVNKLTIQYLLREATWHGKPVTKGQIQMLARLFPKRLFPISQMTSGQASKIISERLARR